MSLKYNNFTFKTNNNIIVRAYVRIIRGARNIAI